MTLLKIVLVAVLVIAYTLPAQAVGDFSTVQIRGAKSADISDVVFGPVQQEDTLWKIAKDYRNSPDYQGIKTKSLYPVMYAIYLKNPQAFIGNNVNHLRNDVMLEMPSSSFINSLDLAESERKIESDESKWGYQDVTQDLVDAANTNIQQDVSNTQSNIPTQVPEATDDIAKRPSSESVVAVLNQTESVASQQQIINEIRAQYAVSLDTIQILLEENKKLSSQVNDVAQRLETLASQVNDDVQSQSVEQAKLQAHLFALLENGAADETEVETSPWVEDIKALMSEPLVVIASVSLTVLVSLVIFGLWLFRRRQPEALPEQINEDEVRAQIEDIEFTPGDGEMDQSGLDALFADSGSDDSAILDNSSDADHVTSTKLDPASDDVLALDDLNSWLSEDSDKQVLDEIENVDFDDLLDSLDKDLESPEKTGDFAELSDDILGDLSFDSFAEVNLDETKEDTEQVQIEEDKSTVETADNENPDYLDVDVLLQETDSLEVVEPDLDVLKNIPGIPDAVPSLEVLQDDVFASNLDLARAYIEIDEYSEAQALLEGVVTHGTDEQVAEAKSLIEQLKNV